MTSPITNGWNESLPKARLNLDSAFLYVPEKDDDCHYSHHPFITHHKGCFFAMWSTGWRNEDDVGQRVMVADSKDFETWSSPRVLVPTEKGRHNDLTRYAEGWHSHGDTLVAYYAQFEYEPGALVDGHRLHDDRRHMDTRLFAITSTDGETWSDPIDTGLRMGPNHGPEPTASGRLIIATSFTYPYTDDPSGLSGWTLSGIYPKDMNPDEIVDDSEWIWKMKDIQGWPNVLCEGSWYQTDDAVLHMLLRSNTGLLWVTESRDDGESWSAPEPTGFTNNSSKFHTGRLPDGRWYWVGNPEPKPVHGRCPLALLLSEDGVRFDRHFILADESTLYQNRLPGMHKGGQYGYPHTVICNGAFHVIVSRVKEAVQVLRVPLDALAW